MIVGRTGHMDEHGNYVEDTVTVLVEDPGGWSVVANDETEQAARERGQEKIEEAKVELRKQVQARLQTGDLTPEQAERTLREANA